MPDTELLDKLIGTGLSEQAMLDSFKDIERRLLQKLVTKFSLDDKVKSEIIIALYRFRQTLEHFVKVWRETSLDLDLEERGLAEKKLKQVEFNLNREAHGCFSENNFFGHLVQLLHLCKSLQIPARNVQLYIKWVCQFPVVPISSIKEIFEHELSLSIMPYVHMDMTAGFIREELVTRRLPHKQIVLNHMIFLREQSVQLAHSRWFRGRAPGSFGLGKK